MVFAKTMDLGNHIAIVRVRKHKFNLNTGAPHMMLLNFTVIGLFLPQWPL